MALPEILKAKVSKTLKKFCNDKIPPHVREKIKLEFDFRGNGVTLFEIRPVWNDPSQRTQSAVAQFRFDSNLLKWTLFCRDRNSNWHLYTQTTPTADFDLLVKEMDRDPTGIFWG